MGNEASQQRKIDRRHSIMGTGMVPPPVPPRDRMPVDPRRAALPHNTAPPNAYDPDINLGRSGAVRGNSPTPPHAPPAYALLEPTSPNIPGPPPQSPVSPGGGGYQQFGAQQPPLPPRSNRSQQRMASTASHRSNSQDHVHRRTVSSPAERPEFNTMDFDGSVARTQSLAVGVGGFRQSMTASQVNQRQQPSRYPSVNTNIRHEPVITESPTTTAPPSPVTRIRQATRRSSGEDPLLLLKKYDVIFLVDDSSSMEGARWYEAREAVAGVAQVATRYDEDGVDLYFLNSPEVGKNLRSAEEVEELFDLVQPDGITPTGERLEELLLEYLELLEASKYANDLGKGFTKVKPINILVITDGEPTDDPGSVIVQAAKRLDAQHFPLSQVGIQFIQIGNDPAATEALEALDDDLAQVHGIRDIVDTVPFSKTNGQLSAETLCKILLGGINRRIDKGKNTGR